MHSAKTLSDCLHLLDFRAGIEAEAASMAARHHGPEQLDELSGALNRFQAGGNNPSARLNCDFEFHLAIARASQNPYIIDAVSSLRPSMISMPLRRLETHDAASSGDRLLFVNQEQRSIFDAIIANDPMAAAAAMRSHLVNSKMRLAFEAGCRKA
ncbi:FadR/GntR family transcriptional regulator [Paeniglutamicibacter sp. MACA_103]|uniref:FadR/GntR family transcriptional regulator n=1 Tax=Paeniglutamicibacter sp. MACA_103 TaxID=3377337 RepID=UPI00389486ED